MKWMVLVCAAVITACTYAPVVQNPTDSAVMAPDAAGAAETRRLEQSESDCARQGKHAQADRVEGRTVYTCSD